MPPSVPRVNQVVIIPGFGHSNPEGEFDPGREMEGFREVDLIDVICRPLQETLEEYAIRNRVLETRKPPGHSPDTLAEQIEPYTLILHIRLGIMDRKNKRNVSQVWYGSRYSLQIADAVLDCLSDWGNCTVFGHRTANPKLNESDGLLALDQCHGLRIEPFALNGPDISDYVNRLARCGYETGLLLSNYLRQRDEAVCWKALSY